ncbi:FAD-binding dehydrogenase [Gordonia sp. PDNC005]|uniref:FAD-binding dehydrogenase n=1 Tax=unclassified Gordonia (in: high G+C Gram-positive bacteria) TaxID=2657482 RepID=UPI0019659049|nr:FAD-binding dehydrogenase [Gordonia sp. PDNC005]QRY63344.1 FAD-binding dehydrogenase [Gordonia sp. PDNC005]
MGLDDHTINRRSVLVGGSVAAAGLVASSLAGQAGAAPRQDADVIVVGHGLAGLVAASELAAAGRSVIVVDQESRSNLGGQAHWSLGGLFFVNSPEQRQCQIRDSIELARADWFGSAGFDRKPHDRLGEDYWARQWAESYLNFAAGEKRSWLERKGVRWVPVVGWAERGGTSASGHGNSVPRFHMTLGTGPGVVEPFRNAVLDGERRRRISFRFRHRVDELITDGGRVTGVRGKKLAASNAPRGVKSNRTVIGDFELRAPITLVASGGIGANHELIRQNWPSRLGAPPKTMVTGVPAHVDGRMLAITEAAGGRIVNRDRMWHYTEGLKNHSPIWPDHGIRVLGAPSSMWFDAEGNRFDSPAIPSYDTLETLAMIKRTGYDYSWFVLNKKIISKEFILSGSEQNPELTRKDLVAYLASRALDDVPKSVQKFVDKGVDFVQARSVDDLVRKMNRLAGSDLVDAGKLRAQIVQRDRQVHNPFTKDPGVMGIHNSRNYLGDNIVRTVEPHPILDPAAGPLIAIRMNILTRKTLGGLQTNLSGQVMNDGGTPVPGLYAAGEASGFGGGGVHGYNALEGTFLGGCLFSGRAAGRAAARATS